jgi:hypothetical protein
VQKLLPWYVNRTLSKHETELVEAHLSECEECRDDFAVERTLPRDIAIQPLDVDNGWAAMQRRMAEAAEEATIGQASPRRWPVSPGWLLSGALAASVALAVILTNMQSDTPAQNTYRTLGSGASSAEGQIVVLFKPDTTEQQMRIILAAQNARLIDGPTASGAYVLHIDRGDPLAAITRLRQSNQVILAEALASDGRP